MSKDEKDLDNLIEDWISFSNDLSERVKKVAEEGQVECQEFTNLWSEYSRSMTKAIRRFEEDEYSTEKFENIWKDYHKDFEERFKNCMSGETETAREIFDIWSTYSEKIGNNLLEIMNKRFREQQDMYQLWMDAFCSLNGEKSSTEKNPFLDMMKQWTGMMEKANMKTPPAMEMPASPEEFMKKCRDMQEEWSNKYAEALRDFTTSENYAEWSGNTVNQLLEQRELINNLTTEYMRNLGLPTQKDMDGIRQRLYELEKKIDDLKN